MKKLIHTILLLAIISLAGSVSAFAQTKHKLVAAERVDKVIKKKNLQVLDVRTPEEVQEGHLPGAINIDFKSADFKSKLNALPKDESYLVYCRSGVRSGKAVEMMKSLGFKRVYELEGGITAYRSKEEGAKSKDRR